VVPNLRLHLLGDFLLLSGDKPLSGIDVPRLQSLLAYLVLHHNTPQPRSHLAYLLWPDSTESQAHTNLRNILHKLRQSLPNADTFLQAQRQELQWQPHGLWTVDVLDFGQALTRAEEAEQAKHMQAALAMAEQTGDVTVQSYCLTYLTLVKRKRGQVEETQRFSSQALIIATAVQRSEDVGASEANLAWAALCENKLSEAQVHGQIALKMWQQTPLVYPFHWTALLPLICVALVQNQIPGAVNYVQELLAPEQQCLPGSLTAALKATIQAWNTGQPETAQTQLARVVTLAQELGYL